MTRPRIDWRLENSAGDDKWLLVGQSETAAPVRNSSEWIHHLNGRYTSGDVAEIGGTEKQPRNQRHELLE